MTTYSLMIRRNSVLVSIIVAILAGIALKVASARPAHIEQEELAQERTTQTNYHKHMNSPLHIHKLSPTSNNITCNDGSQVGYYKRLNSRSKSWIIYLQGGGFCGSEESCQQRWLSTPHLMSSKLWPKTKTVEGILSNEPKDNPHLWSANHIYVPYCSSDSWTGLAASSADGSTSSRFSFMGSRILEKVFDSLYDDLPRESSLHEAKFILLAGDSAGATGVILNLDKVNEIIEKRASSISADCGSYDQAAACAQHANKQPPVLRGLADSGWFLDNEPYELGSGEAFTGGAGELEIGGTDCDRNRCTPSQSIKQAMTMWNGQLPLACADQYPTEPWRCYFGYRAYQTLKTPLFVVQWLYDEVQLLVDNISRPDTSSQWRYVNKVVNEMRASLQNVTALFAPSCFSHSLIIRRSWNQINIGGYKLPHVLNIWEQQSIFEATSAISRRRVMIKNDDNSRIPTSNFGRNYATRQAQIPMISTSNRVNSTGSYLVLDSITSDPEQSPPAIAVPAYVRDNDRAQSSSDQQLMTPKSTPSGTARTRTRKRRRNNQQIRSKQARQKSNQNSADSFLQAASDPTHPVQKESNDLTLTNNQQDLIPIDRFAQDLSFSRLARHASASTANNARSGRSTMIDDATPMISNNVPDDNAGISHTLSASEKDKIDPKILWVPGVMRTHASVSVESNSESILTPNAYFNANTFRLIDSCGWPQCNRDCPVLDTDFNT